MCKIVVKFFTLAGSGRTSTSFIYLNERSPEEGYEVTHL